MKNPDFCRDFCFMHITLFDDHTRYKLLPFTHTRPIADIRCGIWTMRERWEHYLQQSTDTLTEKYLQAVFPHNSNADHVYVNATVFASKALADAIALLEPGHKLMKGNFLIAARITGPSSFDTLATDVAHLPEQHTDADIYYLEQIWDIFSLNDRALRDDFAAITQARKSETIPEGITVTGKDNIFIEEGAQVYPGCIINAKSGPVYIGKDAEILEGTMIRGPLAVCEHGVIKMGAKIYGATTIGPNCKVGGELNNVVFFANSNKAHDGYLGNAVIGEWCNLGADTNCSNLKNNYDDVKIWDEYNSKSIRTGLIFCGLLMGDHSKCAINTMFNTGTVAGVSCNIYSSGFPEKFIPSFSWGGSDGITTYSFDRAMQTAERMMARRGKQLSAAEIDMYRHIFDQTEELRNLFNKSN